MPWKAYCREGGNCYGRRLWVKPDVTCARSESAQRAWRQPACHMRLAAFVAARKQRLDSVSEQCLLWCPLRCEIPLFIYYIWYSPNRGPGISAVFYEAIVEEKHTRNYARGYRRRPRGRRRRRRYLSRYRRVVRSVIDAERGRGQPATVAPDDPG
jgi:hypothetical protein